MSRANRTSSTRRSVKALSAVDVYDLASAVKEEFEKVTELVGNEPLILLVSKVVDVLEHLDRLTQVLQTQRIELEDLRLMVEKQKENAVRGSAERENLLKEKDILEKNWKQKTNELTEYAAKIQEENLSLRLDIEQLKNESYNTLTSRQELSQLSQEVCILREKMFGQKDELIQLKQSLIQKEAEIEALQLQLDRFTKLNADYRIRYSASTRQIQQLLDEKAELESHTQDKSQNSSVPLRRKKNQNTDKTTSRYGCSFQDLDEDGKIDFGCISADHPYCSEKEMNQMVKECKDLKTRLLEAEAELSIYRSDLGGGGDDEADEGGEDAPVQGPINEEPEEKLFPERFQKPTVIQRLFQNILGSSSKSPTTCKSSPTNTIEASKWY